MRLSDEMRRVALTLLALAALGSLAALSWQWTRDAPDLTATPIPAQPNAAAPSERPELPAVNAPEPAPERERAADTQPGPDPGATHGPAAAGVAPPSEATPSDGSGVSVNGVVLDASGRPVAHAEVGFAPFEDGRAVAFGMDGRSVKTDATGRWTLTGLSPGRIMFFAGAPGHGPGSSGPHPLEPDTSPPFVRISLPVERTLPGRIAGPSGKPIAGVSLTAWQETGGTYVDAEATSDAEGRFVLRGLVAGAATVTADKEGHTAWQRELPPGVESLEIRLYRPVAVTVVVTASEPSCPPIVRTAVTQLDQLGDDMMAGWPETRPARDTEGPAEGSRSLTLELEAPSRNGFGRVQVHVLAADGRIAVSDAFRPDTRRTADPIRLHLGDAPTLRGRVLTPNGLPLRGAVVRYRAPDPSEVRSAEDELVRDPPAAYGIRTDQAGEFALRVAGDGPYVLVVEPPAFGYVRGFGAVRGRMAKHVSEPFAAGAALPSAPLTITLAATDANAVTESRVQGTVRDTAGEAVAHAAIRLRREHPPGTRTTWEFRADEEGRFAPDRPLPVGTYAVELEIAGRPYRDLPPVTVEARAKATIVITVRLATDAPTLSGVVRLNGTPFAAALVHVWPDADRARCTTRTANADGSFAVPLEAAAIYHVGVTASATTPLLHVERFSAGQVASSVALDVRPAQRTARIVDSTGAAMAGTKVYAMLFRTLDGTDVVVGRNAGEAVAGDGGTVQFPAMAPGHYLLTTFDGVWFRASGQDGVPHMVIGGAASGEAVLERTASGSVGGRVVDAGGASLAAVPVRCLDHPYAIYFAAVTDDEGRYRFPDVWPGPMRITAAAGPASATATARVRSGEETTADLRLK
jgi:protocatechuate 3,4-dioxygenase beta subunit